MLGRARAFASGLHFRFLLLVIGIAGALLAAQLVTDTLQEVRRERDARLNEALSITAVIARSLEKQFEMIELDDIEDILAKVRERPEVMQLTVVDRDLTFFLDGDPRTSPIVSFNYSDVQLESLKTSATVHSVTGDRIKVGEPLLSNGVAIGSVMIEFRNPGFWQTLLPVLAGKLLTSAPILVAAMLFAIGLVTQITRPLRKLAATAMAVSDGNLDQAVEIGGAAEIRQLGQSFNAMIATVKGNIEQIYELAYVDRITQLPNREYFRMELTRAINRAQRTGRSGALLFVDLDGFKRVNDTLGHDLGDKLLAAFSERMKAIVRSDDTISFNPAPLAAGAQDAALRDASKEKQVLARLGGDEFTVLLSEIREETDAATVSRRIIRAMSEPFEIGGTEIRIGASVGIATFPRDGSNHQQVLKSADMAMYLAKEEGKNTFRYFSEELNLRASRRLEVETDLRKALSQGQLELHYQPKVDTRTGKPVSMEALVRWNHPQRGMVHPGEFIRIAEESGLIMPLGEWVLKAACAQIATFASKGLDMPMAVNISPQQFEQADFSDRVLEIVRREKVKPGRLELEITESMAMSDPGRALDHIRKLKRAGIRFAIDDFGTGHSNLSQLSRLPFDVFKIDRSFVDTLAGDGDPHGTAIVRTILAMAQSLNYETVAEGVETVEQQRLLAEMGCTLSQGYLFARPMPAEDLLRWVQDRRAEPARPARQGKRKAA
jgi:predicted signal transduction protein with EAL and GGDEF domain